MSLNFLSQLSLQDHYGDGQACGRIIEFVAERLQQN